MADPAAQLWHAVMVGDNAATAEALAAGADPNSVVGAYGATALAAAAANGFLASIRALLAVGAAVNAHGAAPLHEAAGSGHTRCVAALLAAGADPCAVDAHGRSALHNAASRVASWEGGEETVCALLAAAPGTALLKDRGGRRPLDGALEEGLMGTACCLLKRGPLPPADEVLAALEAAQQGLAGERALPLYAPLVARQPLKPAEWARVPAPCPSLGAVLPAVLQRSDAEAALLVGCLPAGERARLRTAALCVRRTERLQGAELPPALLRPLLLAAVE